MVRWAVAVVLVFLVGGSALVIGGAPPGRSAPVGPAAAGFSGVPPFVDAPGLGEHLDALARIARTSGGNRAAGTLGDRRSRAYVAERLRAAGWRVREQPVRAGAFEERAAPRLALGDAPLRPRGDVRSLGYSGAGEAAGHLHAVGVRLGRERASGCRRSDFRALPRGDVALVQRGVCTFRRKVQHAQAAGAAAVLVVNDGRLGRTAAPTGTLGPPPVTIPALGVGTRTGAELLRAGARTARVRVTARSETLRTANVIADLPGGPAGRVVMAGAHLDSVPAGPGVNDNGSGVATLLEVAEGLGARVAPEGAGVRLAFWGAEEIGLVGSRRYVGALSSARRRAIAAYLNFDMVGSPNAAPAVYRGEDARSRRIERILRDAAQREGPVGSVEIGGRSDHAPFVAAGVPVGGLYTGAEERKTERQAREHGGRAGRPFDPCYHEACDRRANVDERVLARMARAAGAALVVLTR